MKDIVNDQLLPRMIKHGFPVKGLHFEWDDSVDYTPEQQLEYEKMILDRFEVDPKYLIDKYGVPITGKKAVPDTSVGWHVLFRLGPADYAGLHERINLLYQEGNLQLAADDYPDTSAIESAFEKAMKWLHGKRIFGAGMLKEKPVRR